MENMFTRMERPSFTQDGHQVGIFLKNHYQLMSLIGFKINISDYYPSTNPANTCAVMDPSSGMWLPVSCTESRAYMCSVDLVQG